jgi:organic hydroperoxide reductase OsmC/OhrA
MRPERLSLAIANAFKMREHRYVIRVTWIGNCGEGTSTYKSYSRDHEIGAAGKSAVIPAGADPAFLGDASRYNPEELLVASLSSCHMLWALHLCANAGIVVTEYVDEPTGTMREERTGGEFVEVVLRPSIAISDASRADDAVRIQEEAHARCFIARSVNFPVRCEPTIRVAR